MGSNVPAMNESTNEITHEMNHLFNCGYKIKWSYDPRSYERNLSNCVLEEVCQHDSRGYSLTHSFSHSFLPSFLPLFLFLPSSTSSVRSFVYLFIYLFYLFIYLSLDFPHFTQPRPINAVNCLAL